eukprot:342470-Hanusia_phi.AAC.1
MYPSKSLISTDIKRGNKTWRKGGGLASNMGVGEQMHAALHQGGRGGSKWKERVCKLSESARKGAERVCSQGS